MSCYKTVVNTRVHICLDSCFLFPWCDWITRYRFPKWLSHSHKPCVSTRPFQVLASRAAVSRFNAPIPAACSGSLWFQFALTPHDKWRLSATYIYALAKGLFLFCQFFSWVFSSLSKSGEFFIYSELKSFIRHVLHKYSLPICAFSCYSLNDVF